MAIHSRVKVFFDGGCRPAPLGIETAVVVRGHAYFQRGLIPAIGPATSTHAEWLALIHAVTVARDLGLTDPIFLGDALAVIGQVTGAARCRGASVPYLSALKLASPAPLHIRYVKRTQNLAGIALSRLHGR